MRSIVEQHYMEEIPDTAGARESDQLAVTTLARIDSMKYQALLGGHLITMQGVAKGAEDKFPHQEFPDHPKGERIQLSTHLEASKLIREHRQKQRE